MPVTTQASGTLDKPYENGNPSSPSSFTSQDLRGGAEGSNLSPNGSISSYSRTNSFDSLDGSNSSTSSNYGGGHSRQISNDSSASGADYIPTRSIKQASKPLHNPLQFVKVGSCSLSKKAEEQIKKYDEVKKLKTVKQDEEDWQHNLDNWKSKRRLSSSTQKSHDKPDEFQKFEEEYKQKPRRKSKTFSEMVEQRSKRGRNFGYFSDEWEDGDKNSWNGSDSPRHDMSLDSSCAGDTFHEDESDASSVDKNHPESAAELKERPSENLEASRSSEPKLPVNGHENGVKDGSSNEEYTFDKAIQSYVQYAESQKKSNRDKKTLNGDHSQSTKKSPDTISPVSTPLKESIVPKMECAESTPSSFCGERTGGTETTIIVKLKSSSERDFGFTTRSQGRGLVFVDTMSFRGSAEISGLKVDDEILAINGESVSNRSLSAIVFAIKQAVYTGQLELRIYRYDNAQQVLKQSLNGAAIKKPSRVEERKAVFSRGDSACEKEPSPEKRTVLREQSPKVDIVKRRSLFESPPREMDVQQQRHSEQRHSVDASSGWRNKAPSMDNLSSKPHESNEDGDSANPVVETKKINKKLDFKKKLASFENLETAGKTPELRPASERKQSLKDRIATFEKPDKFERSQSCDQLDTSAQNKPLPVVKHDKSGTLPNFQEQNDEVDGGDDYSCTNGMHHDQFFEELLGPPRIIDVVKKDDGPAPPTEPCAPAKKDTAAPQETKPEASNLPKPKAARTDVVLVEEEPMQKVAVPTRPEAEDISNSNDCMIRSKSDFELADSLEETAFLGSNSPTEREPCNAALIEFDKFEEPEVADEQLSPVPNDPDQKIAYLNEISMEPEVKQLHLSNLGEGLIIIDDFDFDAPPRFLEPPKEKPPPPPTEMEMLPEQPDPKNPNLKRADSTKRIKKELRRLRTDFLGFETPNEHVNLENGEPKTSPKLDSLPPREKPVAKKSPKNIESTKQDKSVPLKPNEDDDLARKEQQIIEDLEREEQQQKLAKLEQNAVEETHSAPAKEVAALVEAPKPVLEEPATKIVLDEDVKLREREEQLRMQEEFLRLEREKLRQEQEELRRQREEYIKQIQQHQSMYPPPINNANNRRDVSNGVGDPLYRNSSEAKTSEPHPPSPKNDSKPPNATSNLPSSPGELRRDDIIRLSRQPGLEMPRNSPTEENISRIQNGSEDLPRQTPKQVSSRPPLKAKLTNGEKCVARRKQEQGQRDPSAYNQHWLIQEAEMRRISEHNNHMQQARSPTKEPPAAAAENIYSQQRTMTSPNPSAPPHSRKENKQNGVSKDPVPRKNNLVKKLSSEQQQNPVKPDRKELEIPMPNPPPPKSNSPAMNGESQMLSVSGKKKCSHCGDELGKGAAMIIESLHLFYHIHCFKCCVCHVQLGNGLSGADVRVRNQKLHCHNCYSNDEAGLKFSKV